MKTKMTSAHTPTLKPAELLVTAARTQLDTLHLVSTKRCGYVHSVHTGAAVDGPGVRYLMFVAGCNFRCLYCHNCDTWTAQSDQFRTTSSVLSDIGKYAPFLKRFGGLTISGGDPLTQPDFVGEVFAQTKRLYGLHTALDTQGSLAHRVPDSWFDPVDLVLLDIKHIDPDQHFKLTGYPLQPTLDCAQRLSRIGKAMWIRYVMVPGWTDDPRDAEKLADYITTLKTVQRVEVLPFHQMGAHKWADRRIPYALKDARPPEPEQVELVRECFRSRGIETY